PSAYKIFIECSLGRGPHVKRASLWGDTTPVASGLFPNKCAHRLTLARVDPLHANNGGMPNTRWALAVATLPFDRSEERSVLRIAAMTLVRHRLPRAALFLIAAASLFAAAPVLAFTLDDVVTRAQALAGKPYVAPVSNLPPAFNQLQFGDYAQIQSKPQRFGWRELDTPFKLNFYHQGMQFNVPVKINEINGSAVEEIKY